MPEITSLSKSSKVHTGFMPLEDMLVAFYENNARQHSLNLDIKDLAERLLALGWCEHVTFNVRLGKIVDGHGRVLASQWLTEQAPEWFTYKLKVAKQRKTLSQADEERYSPLYWTQVSILATDLDDMSHAAMNLGLNNEKVFGYDDPEKVSRITSAFDDDELAIAGFDRKIKAIVSEIVEESAQSRSLEGEYQDKQFFERPDATDYTVRNKDPNREEMPVTVLNDDDLDDGEQEERIAQEDFDGEFLDNFNSSNEEEIELKPQKTPYQPTLLKLAVPFSDWKKFNKWKKQEGIDKDTDAFWKGLQEKFPDDLSFAKVNDPDLLE